jgi:hypothetical protein
VREEAAAARPVGPTPVASQATGSAQGGCDQASAGPTQKATPHAESASAGACASLGAHQRGGGEEAHVGRARHARAALEAGVCPRVRDQLHAWVVRPPAGPAACMPLACRRGQPGGGGGGGWRNVQNFESWCVWRNGSRGWVPPLACVGSGVRPANSDTHPAQGLAGPGRLRGRRGPTRSAQPKRGWVRTVWVAEVRARCAVECLAPGGGEGHSGHWGLRGAGRAASTSLLSVILGRLWSPQPAPHLKQLLQQVCDGVESAIIPAVKALPVAAAGMGGEGGAGGASTGAQVPSGGGGAGGCRLPRSFLQDPDGQR